jgi:hypothetical protein
LRTPSAWRVWAWVQSPTGQARLALQTREGLAN